ncbi:DUF6531 domain-containing protein [Hymenobacter weizhouensis]|uniref:DUF6531 domain-containing protein n=1 Tax=Hymenobacter sp. YIM 151500-1 TaxID=2987689 RepID=UPI002225FD33|nr:DUF6531 domain-containing protein [Hymenobacter sp. YIM 151500-1]UYZ62611.1 DUF6531 domain-containing protein [Hymenobacter sp. YIM 151500-1]
MCCRPECRRALEFACTPATHTWYSTSIYQGPLGHGWHHAYDLALCVDAEESAVAMRAADGRGIAFNMVPVGQRDYNRREKMTLLHDVRGYAVLDHGAELI